MKLVTVLELAQLPVDGNNRPRGYTTTIASENDTNNHANSGGGNDINDDDHGGPVGPRTRFFIKGQEDHYQIEEFLKFIAPWGAAPLWIAWQRWHGRLSLTADGLLTRYGPIVRISPQMVLLNDGPAVNAIFSRRDLATAPTA